MSLTFPTTTLKFPSGLVGLPDALQRPAFGALHGFDAKAESGSVAAFAITANLTRANITLRTGDSVGTIAYGTDTYDFYVYDGSTGWHVFPNAA